MEKMISSNEMGYLEHLGLNRNPFPVAPDDENFFISNHIEQILAEIIHGFVARKGFMVLSGDTGLGKTSISRRILRVLEEKGIETSLVFHTSCRNIELLREINRDFGLETGSLRFGDLLNELSRFLTEKNKNNQNCAVIVDDAQNLDQKSLELIRMISNYEADQKKLVQILLIGQPELVEKLNQPELRQLKSRIIIWKQVNPLLLHELENYLYFKLNLSGNSGLINVSKSAVKAVFNHTRGNLRQINILMDRCLYAAYLEGTTAITQKIVEAAYLDINPQNKRSKSRFNPILVTTCITLLLLFLVYSGSAHIASVLEPIVAVSFIGKNNHPLVNQQEKLPAITPVMEIPPIQKSLQLSIQAPPKLPTPIDPPFPTEKVSIFLQAYRLASYQTQFLQALRTNNFARLSIDIYNQTGYCLIRLPALPEGVKGQYDILVRDADQMNTKEYVLFWHPDPKIDEFYYGYHGNGIHQLQETLKEMSLYQYELDGIVGKGVLKGLISFQKKWNLPVTGYPDNNTLFLLHHLKGSKYGSRKEEKISG